MSEAQERSIKDRVKQIAKEQDRLFKNVLSIEKVKHAINETFTHRQSDIELIPVYSGDDGKALSDHWQRHLRSLGDSDVSKRLPQSFASVLRDINTWLEKHIGIK